MMSHSSIITSTISSLWDHWLPLSATTTFKPVFDVKHLAYHFIQISWSPRLVLQYLGFNLSLKNFSNASQLTREIGLLHC